MEIPTIKLKKKEKKQKENEKKRIGEKYTKHTYTIHTSTWKEIVEIVTEGIFFLQRL